MSLEKCVTRETFVAELTDTEPRETTHRQTHRQTDGQSDRHTTQYTTQIIT